MTDNENGADSTDNVDEVNILDSDTQVIAKPTKEERLIKLKTTAKELKINFSPQIGPDALSRKINDFLDGDQEEEHEKATAQAIGQKTVDASRLTTPARIVKLKEAQRLVLVKVVCMNPSKKEWDGEIFTVGNSVVGTYKKFVKFNADRGWYMPQIMYNVLASRKCQLFKTIKVNGRKIRQGYLINEFAMTILPNQTKEELKAESFKQAASQALGQ